MAQSQMRILMALPERGILMAPPEMKILMAPAERGIQMAPAEMKILMPLSPLQPDAVCFG